jgi:spore maturation protein CgeB
MKLVVFGLTVTSSWGNGHATLWRGLLEALAHLGHRVTFFEKDVPYYAWHRDRRDFPGHRLVLYPDWAEALSLAKTELAAADVAMVTSYCPDGVPASELVLDTAGPLKTFYDLDTPVTLERLRAGERVPYLPASGLAGFDLVLSYTGGAALGELQSRLGARSVSPLYGSVDPAAHRPSPGKPEYAADLSYLGTYAEDRQEQLDRLFLQPARQRPGLRFLIGGSLYPPGFPWGENVFYVRHVPPSEHPAFYGSSALTLNVTRAAMARMGYCPSGRLFEAAACGVPILSDDWEGLDRFFAPGREILVARSTAEALEALALPRADLARIAAAARERTLAEHTAERRARQMLDLFAAPPAAVPALEPALAGVGGMGGMGGMGAKGRGK